MMTREKILSIEEYCAEHKISHKKRLEELGIPFWNFYKAKHKYRMLTRWAAAIGFLILLGKDLRFIFNALYLYIIMYINIRALWLLSVLRNYATI